MLEELVELVKEYEQLKKESTFAYKFCTVLESLVAAIHGGNKDNIDYYVKRSKQLLEEYYRRGN